MIETCLQESEFDLDESFLCIDYVNTLEWRESDVPREAINSYDELVAWSNKKAFLTDSEAESLLKKAARNKKKALEALQGTRDFRALLDKIFTTTSAGKLPTKGDLSAFNKILGNALCNLELIQEDNKLVFDLCCLTDLASPIIWPIAVSAAQLLTSEELDRIGICKDADGCGYFFHDTSKNQSKKYCGSNCATRAKVRRFRSKKN